MISSVHHKEYLLRYFGEVMSTRNKIHAKHFYQTFIFIDDMYIRIYHGMDTRMRFIWLQYRRKTHGLVSDTC